MGINKINLVGRTGQDPDVKYFESGSVKATVSLAVDTGKNQTSWFFLEFWNQQAEIVQSYVQKGKQLAVEGSLSFEFWNDRNTGEARSKPVVRVNSMKLLGGRNDNQGGGYGNGGYGQQQQQPAYANGGGYNNQQPSQYPGMNNGGYQPQPQQQAYDPNNPGF